LVSVSLDGIADSYILKVRAELQNGWLMDYWEHSTTNLRRYSFHVFQGNQMISRWDNAPHHPSLSTSLTINIPHKGLKIPRKWTSEGC
jgi:hypothetical protein